MPAAFSFAISQTKGEGKEKTVERQLDLTHTKKKMTWILNFLDVHISIVDLTNSAGKKNIYTLVSFLELFYFFLPLLLLQFGAWVLSLSFILWVRLFFLLFTVKRDTSIHICIR